MSEREPPRASRPEPSLYFLAADEGRGLLPWEHVCEELAAARNYWVATAGAGARPHAMPVWGVWLEPELWFSTSPVSRKARNLRANPSAAVHLESGDRVVVLEGPVREVRAAPELARFVAAYNPKYTWSFSVEELEQHAVFAVAVHKAFAWLDGEGEGFSGTATRFAFPAAAGVAGPGDGS